MSSYSYISQILILVLCFQLCLSVSEYNTLVYKSCATQTFTDSTNAYSHSLSLFFQELITQSSHSKFFKTTAARADDSSAISGLFQCREDLTNNDCYNCITTLPQLSNTLCDKALAARIQLFGCYFLYEADGFGVNYDHESHDDHDLLHKTCGEKEALLGRFEEAREAAFAAVQGGLVGGKGFFTVSYAAVDVVAQCEGDLGGCECSECVSKAMQIAREECVGSVSGEVYLDKCFLSYGYYEKGIPGESYPEKRKGGNTGKSVAIVLGGAAALFFGFIFLLFIKSLRKKDDDY